MTEDEARTKWCPQVRVIDDLSACAASTRLRAHNTRCIASGCMMWEWDEEQVGEKNLYRNSATRGDCGLKRRDK